RRPGGATATRFRIDEAQTVVFDDGFQGQIALPMGKLGDVIVRRRDGVFAYQLAVVVDDALQGITEVVRGADLLESTGWQIALQRTLKLPTPRYAHLPLLLERTGGKLSKSRRSMALDVGRAGAEMLQVLRLLGLTPPAGLACATPATLLEWATGHWRGQPPPQLREVILPETRLPT
ncbi:MAG TPA: glutamate--tRNA ligase family protein, partial [Steroidobacteraceae bacterium]